MKDRKSRKRSKDRSASASSAKPHFPPTTNKELRAVVVEYMLNDKARLPLDSLSLFRIIKKQYRDIQSSRLCFKGLNIMNVLTTLLEKDGIVVEEISIGIHTCYLILTVNQEKLGQLYKEYLKDKPKNMDAANAKIRVAKGNESSQDVASEQQALTQLAHSTEKEEKKIEEESQSNDQEMMPYKVNETEEFENDLQSLLKKPTAKQKELIFISKEIGDLLQMPTAREKSIAEKFKSKGGSKLRAFCQHGTKIDCMRIRNSPISCNLVHFKRIIKPHTDVSLGDCSYLDTCRHMDYCKFIHYAIDEESDKTPKAGLQLNAEDGMPSQWINCDVRFFDFTVFGKFDIVLADPPWDIHMDLPYGTMKDDEMKNLKINILQDEGLIFLWVTGRAMELGRECLEAWGYKKAQELIWVKTNQLQRIIRTGRTGHWLNHSKEHCLIGIKGNPKFNRFLDCDILVSEVRETSRKPDELYELIERMHPGGRKIEIFARPHNRRHNWVSVGNQLPTNYICDDSMIQRWNESYPNNSLSREEMEKAKYNSIQILEEDVRAT